MYNEYKRGVNMLIKTRITEKGYKLGFIANEIQISPKTLNNWIHYRHFENIIKFLKLLKFLNISIEDILKDYDNYKETN